MIRHIRQRYDRF